tara:strand:- start:164 stop:379 length:216 start_codon:yes stop_codon:yes gene_type:complete
MGFPLAGVGVGRFGTAAPLLEVEVHEELCNGLKGTRVRVVMDLDDECFLKGGRGILGSAITGHASAPLLQQ